ncbi:Uu.00g103760.m01.CDS01 [Anthostomella pinea]|uniref:Uu.00g103760.m01.CDS01 n=1 Tax=Anthostomella pinea TaxID=933095 RepID=A0AAI8YFJ2_9PEZI|nr:Uu.00g103760.m01.CDS01 [Anthostomella pinea]
MAQVQEITALPAEMRSTLDISGYLQKDPEKVHESDASDKSSVAVGHVQDDAVPQYTDEQYKKIKRKMDRYLLPLMWLCYGIQQADKTAIGTQANFGLREDTHLFPSNFILQRLLMGRTLSCYMICWGVVVLCIGFAQNFTQLITLRALQGMFECCISPGFILVIGSWYTTREHASRSLVFQSANAGFGVIANLILYGIGTVQYRRPDFEAWRYMSYFLGGMTLLTGCACLFLLGTPSEVRWLSPEEKKMANARIANNNTGHDRTGVKTWKWKQARECLVDPCFWFAGINAFLSSLPNGGLTTFSSIINTGFGFTNLQVILLDIPRNVISVLFFILVGVVTSRKKNLRMYFMMFSVVPPFIGFIMISLLPNEPQYKWTKWGGYVMTVTYVVALFLAWTLIPSNVAGRTKRTLTSSFTFVGYCVGNTVGSQIFNAKDAPRYIPGTVGCATCFGLEFILLIVWRLILVLRNRRRNKQLASDGLSEEDRIVRAKQLGEQDYTDFENPYFRYTM